MPTSSAPPGNAHSGDVCGSPGRRTDEVGRGGAPWARSPGTASRALAGIACVTLVAFAVAAHGQHSGVRVQVIDRGQAYGILIRTPNERWVVIDAATNGEQADAMATEWNVDRVALAVVSHRHGDNLGGMDDSIDDFPVDRLLMNLADCPDGVGDDRVREAAAMSNVVTSMAGSDAIEIDGVRFVVLPPDPEADRCPDEENNNSIRGEDGGVRRVLNAVHRGFGDRAAGVA